MQTLLQHSAPGLQGFLQRSPVGGRTPTGPRGLKWQRLAETYILGLLLPGERKSMLPIASRADADYEALQQFITDSPWDSEATLDGVIATMKQDLSGPQGAILLDDTPLHKKGTRSPGVAIQYSGLKGHVGSCQTAATALYALPLGPTNADAACWPLGVRLYLPKEWAEDRERMRQVGIPDDIEFRKKWQLGLELVERARRLRVPHRAVVADASYGDTQEFRIQLRAWGEAYVLHVAREMRVVPEEVVVHPPGTKPAGGNPHRFPWVAKGTHLFAPKELARRLPKSEWKTIPWAEGSRGPLVGRFARVRVRVIAEHRRPTEEVGWLLIERTSEGLKTWMCWGLDDLSLEELASLAHLRWAVERGYEEMKSELGWNHFEGRTWNGFHHHAVLTQTAYAYLTWWRWKNRETPDAPMPTLPEARRGVVNHVVERLLEEAKRDLGGRLPLGLQLLAEIVRKGG